MCFSPEFSFGAGAVLAVVGASSIRKATGFRQKVFAGIPLIFSFQQFTEGVLWLALTRPGYESYERISTHIFLFIAQVIWPVYVPLSIFLLGQEIKGGNWLRVLSFTGVLVSVFLATRLYTYPVSAFVSEMHIVYQQHYPVVPFHLITVLYLLVTIVPPFLSGHTKMWLLGCAILFSTLVTQLVFANSFISVWCFFAAIISAVVHQVVLEMNRANTISGQSSLAAEV
jgi:hypothetical protein